MRGRTLNNAFVLLDEAQNTTPSQLKMFLTRMGPSAKVMVNGDRSQIDLPTKQKSGLIQALDILREVPGIGFVEMTAEDVVRHRLVKQIVQAYDRFDVEMQHEQASQANRPIREYQPYRRPSNPGNAASDPGRHPDARREDDGTRELPVNQEQM
jgi:phosphate starvation-inducible PhoH-like protein